MPFDRFLIAPINSGLRTDLRPWLIPEDAWTLMQNSYVFRGRIRKRFGSKYMGKAGSSPLAQLMSRLRINVGVLDGGSSLAGTAPGIIWKVGQIFSVGNTIFTVVVTGPGAMLSTVPGDTGTFDTTTGAFTINSPSNPPVFVYRKSSTEKSVWLNVARLYVCPTCHPESMNSNE